MGPQQGVAWADGRELEFHRYSGGEGKPTVVMLHEGLGSVSTWRDFPEQLAARTGVEIVVYSRYGYGQSTVRCEPFDVDYMHRAALDELPGFLKSLKIEKPILFGHSDGASVALIFAGAYPEAVQSVIVEAPHVFTEDVSVESIAEIQRIYEASDSLRTRLSRHHADPDASFRGWNDVWQLPAFREWNIEEFLPAIKCPVLVVQGEDDEYGTMAQVERIERGCTAPVTRLILEQCGHAPHREQNAAVLEATAAFIDG